MSDRVTSGLRALFCARFVFSTSGSAALRTSLRVGVLTVYLDARFKLFLFFFSLVKESLSAVEVLLRKHETFEKTVTAQLSRIDDLEKFAVEILADHHYNSAGIQGKLQSVCGRRDKLKESSASRRKRLNDSKQLQLFLRNMYEVEGWLMQKQQITMDENYRDPTNLQGKIQKHTAFESELVANKNRLNAVTSEGESLISGGHFAAMEIRARLDKLETDWRKLQEASALKRERLNDAYQVGDRCH